MSVKRPLPPAGARSSAEPPGARGGSLPALRYRSAAGRWVLLATVLGSGMAAIDATVVSIALPEMGRDLHVSLGTLQWVVTSYTLTLAAFLLLGGSLGDRYGRRRIFEIGAGCFALASLGCALAPNAGVLLVMRALQGVGGALLTPGSLAIVEAIFDPDDRAQAIGAWSGLGGVATAIGPLLGGWLIAASSWRLIFVINLPLAALLLAVTARHVPESRDPDPPHHLDWSGGLLVVVGLAALSYGLIAGGASGWADPLVLAGLLGGAAALCAFVLTEAFSKSPMLPLALFRVRRFGVSNAATLFLYAALSGVLFLLPVDLEVVDRYSPLEAGAALLPLTVIMLTLSSRSGRLAARIGPRLQMTLGPILVAAGLVLLARASNDPDYLSGVLPGVVAMGLGLASTVAPLTATALGALPDRQAGMASAINNDVARVGGLLAVAVLPAIAGLSGGAYLHAVALSGGFQTAVYVAAAWCLAAAAASVLGLGPRAAGVGTPAAVSREPASCPLDAPVLQSEPAPAPAAVGRPLGQARAVRDDGTLFGP